MADKLNEKYTVKEIESEHMKLIWRKAWKTVSMKLNIIIEQMQH